MKRNFEYEGDYCCSTMDHAQRDDRWRIDYDPKKKAYFTPMQWPNNDLLIFNYCPWCGTLIRSPIYDENCRLSAIDAALERKMEELS